VAKKTKTSRVVWLRRITQTLFLLFFLYLFLQTVYHPINRVGGRVTLFFELDPLAMLGVWLASHVIVTAMLLALITLGITLIFGRWFCGWICPFGTLHNLFTGIRGGRVKAKLETGGYNRWQKAKYYVLVGLLVGTVMGVNVIGWLDPFSFLYRSLATSVYPAIQWGTTALFGWIYDANPGFGSVRVTAVTEPVYAVLRKYFLAVEQPRYFGGMLIGILFGVVLALNFFRARFWCRYVCPLGALLGLVGKNPLVQFKNNPDQCNNCRLCLADCQGGASPQDPQGWKPSECFFCWNCKSDCPSQAISFNFQVLEEKRK
jgi:polyferredoxin